MNAHARHVSGAKTFSLPNLARQMLDDARGDVNVATERLANYADNIASYRADMLRIGARALLNQVPQSQRQSILRERTGATFQMSAGARAAQARLRSVSAVMKSTLLDMTFIINGVCKPLSEWTGVEIRAHGETELLKGASAVRNARFLIAVGTEAGEKQIGDALDGAAVERLKSQAEASEV